MASSIWLRFNSNITNRKFLKKQINNECIKIISTVFYSKSLLSTCFWSCLTALPSQFLISASLMAEMYFAPLWALSPMDTKLKRFRQWANTDAASFMQANPSILNWRCLKVCVAHYLLPHDPSQKWPTMF